MTKLVRLWKRPCKNGREFKYVLIWNDEQGKERWQALKHANAKKGERQRAQKERELRMGLVEPGSMKLSEFLEDSLRRTGRQIRESTRTEYARDMRHFIKVVGNMDYRKVKHSHGESFRQFCLDVGNTPATTAKKLRHVKRMFQLAVERGQLDEHPFKYVKPPRVAKKTIRVYSEDECTRIVLEAQKHCIATIWPIDLLIVLALTTGMRRGELLNLVWTDIDFAAKTITITPKPDTATTWEWLIKDADHRTLPLTDAVLKLLLDRQATLPEGYPYVLVPPERYEAIQRLRAKGEWTYEDSRQRVATHLTPMFKRILNRTGVPKGRFHDLRSTAITNWFAQGMSEYDVMVLAGHSSFATTHQFYLAVADDLVQRAREASSQSVVDKLLQNHCNGKNEAEEKFGPDHIPLPIKALSNG